MLSSNIISIQNSTELYRTMAACIWYVSTFRVENFGVRYTLVVHDIIKRWRPPEPLRKALIGTLL